MLYIIGTGLNNEKDLSINALNILKRSKKIYIEYYTSKTNINLKNLEQLTNNTITKLYRTDLEESIHYIQEARNEDVALLVIGTPFFATTHSEVLIQAKENKIAVKILHNASIMNVIGSCGLYSYSFGRTVSIPFYEDNWRPRSFYDKLWENINGKLHTLCLLDIRVKEVKKEFMFKENKEFEEERFMDPKCAMEQLLECEAECRKNIFKEETEIFVISRFGTVTEKIVFGKVKDLIKMDFGAPLHSLIIPAHLDLLEKEHIDFLFKK